MKIKSLSEILEEIIDEILKSKNVSDIRAASMKWPSNWANSCNRDEEEKIRKKIEKYLSELEKIYVDPYYKEAYSQYSSSSIQEIKNFFENILKTKRTRVRRVITPRRKNDLKFFKFNKEGDPELKALPFITSPEKINGASACLVWIPKRKMAVWISAKDRTGLAISKNSIVRFDPQDSFAKTVRKPEEFVGVVLKEKKNGVYNYLKSIKTKEYEIDGKMSKKFVIVKVW
ncbi:MAG: hypothetical protein N3A54_01130 [Patescibacteria group bacterium]|nr:hypothetical protein [Patescibacteria group bacterium]